MQDLGIDTEFFFNETWLKFNACLKAKLYRIWWKGKLEEGPKFRQVSKALVSRAKIKRMANPWSLRQIEFQWDIWNKWKKIKSDNEINSIIMIRTRLTGVFFSYIYSFNLTDRIMQYVMFLFKLWMHCSTLLFLNVIFNLINLTKSI